jgi:hypothetical protein
MSHLLPTHHEKSKRDSSNETKIKVKLLNYPWFKFKPHQINDSSQSNQRRTDHLISYKLSFLPLGSNPCLIKPSCSYGSNPCSGTPCRQHEQTTHNFGEHASDDGHPSCPSSNGRVPRAQLVGHVHRLPLQVARECQCQNVASMMATTSSLIHTAKATGGEHDGHGKVADPHVRPWPHPEFRSSTRARPGERAHLGE